MALRLLHLELPWLRGAFNFGGPGWLHPVCDISVQLDSAARGSGVYDSDGVVSGQIIVEGPPQDVSVRHDGVVLSIEEVVVLRDSAEEGILQSVELELASPGTLRGRLELPFGVGLGGCERAWQAAVSGVLFSVRHQLTVRVRRPRYTLDVVERVPLKIVAVGPAQQRDEGALSPDAPSVARHHLLLIDADAEELSMDFSRNCYGVGDTIKGVVVVRTPRQQIHRLEVMLLRSEAVGQDVSEIVVACFDCFNGVFRYRPDGKTAPFREKLPSPEPETAWEQNGSRKVIYAASEGEQSMVQFSYEMDLGLIEGLSPTIFWSTDPGFSLYDISDERDTDQPDGVIFVRYFIRLRAFQGRLPNPLDDIEAIEALPVVPETEEEDEHPSQLWNTAEIFLHIDSLESGIARCSGAHFADRN